MNSILRTIYGLIYLSIIFPLINGDNVRGGYIIQYKDSVLDTDDYTLNTIQRVVRELPTHPRIKITHKYKSVIKGASFLIEDLSDESTILALLRGLPDVKCIIYDQIDQIGGLYTQNIPIANTVEVRNTGNLRIGFISQDKLKTSNVSDSNIAILDTGADMSHPDLINTVAVGYNCVNESDPYNVEDDNGHGTTVSGAISALNQGTGMIGTTPGQKLYIIKVANNLGSSKTSDQICGIEWVADNARRYNIKVASMSIGGVGLNDDNCGDTICDALHKAICELTNENRFKVSMVVSAGNQNVPISTHRPASYPEVLTVTGFTDYDGKPGGLGFNLFNAICGGQDIIDDNYATYSNFALSSIDPMANHIIAAPSTCIYTTYLRSSGLSYLSTTGTSIGAPFIASALSLCYSKGNPCYRKTPAQALQILINNAKQYNLDNPNYGSTIPQTVYYGPLINVKQY